VKEYNKLDDRLGAGQDVKENGRGTHNNKWFRVLFRAEGTEHGIQRQQRKTTNGGTAGRNWITLHNRKTKRGKRRKKENEKEYFEQVQTAGITASDNDFKHVTFLTRRCPI